MKRIHIAMAVDDIAKSVADYSKRLDARPVVEIANEYALWRTEQVNLSIRRSNQPPGTLRHLGWEDSTAPRFSQETDVNGVVWELFKAEHQDQEIKDIWPDARFGTPND